MSINKYFYLHRLVLTQQNSRKFRFLKDICLYVKEEKNWDDVKNVYVFPIKRIDFLEYNVLLCLYFWFSKRTFFFSSIFGYLVLFCRHWSMFAQLNALFLKFCANDFLRLLSFFLYSNTIPLPLFCFSLHWAGSNFYLLSRKLLLWRSQFSLSLDLCAYCYWMNTLRPHCTSTERIFPQHQDRICLCLSLTNYNKKKWWRKWNKQECFSSFHSLPTRRNQSTEKTKGKKATEQTKILMSRKCGLFTLLIIKCWFTAFSANIRDL